MCINDIISLMRSDNETILHQTKFQFDDIFGKEYYTDNDKEIVEEFIKCYIDTIFSYYDFLSNL